jgi:hypothetical protein
MPKTSHWRENETRLSNYPDSCYVDFGHNGGVEIYRKSYPGARIGLCKRDAIKLMRLLQEMYVLDALSDV